jgi:hypothetical protein
MVAVEAKHFKTHLSVIGSVDVWVYIFGYVHYLNKSKLIEMHSLLVVFTTKHNAAFHANIYFNRQYTRLSNYNAIYLLCPKLH